MRDLLLARAGRRPSWIVATVLTVFCGLWALRAGPEARAQTPESPPASSESTPSPIKLPLTARVVTWPVLMVLGAEYGDFVPPILELSFGVKKRWFELSMSAGIAAGRVYNTPRTYIGTTVSAAFYSLQRKHVRLRHGLAFGLLAEVSFERRSAPLSLSPLPMFRVQLLEILVRLGKGMWLEISPLTASFPGWYEASVGFRFELDEPRKRKSAAPEGSPATPPKADRKVHFFLAAEMGLVWWQHFAPPVLGSTFGRVGFRYRWFETALGFGSPAWATWRARGLYEFFVDLAFYSLRRSRLRLRHQVRLGVLFHNPPFEVHTWIGAVMHADFCIVALGLGKGFWVELSPLTISIASQDQLSSSVALRYEF